MEKKIVPTWMSLLLCLLIAVSMYLFVGVMFQVETAFYAVLSVLVYFLACASAFWYCFFGYKKDSAVFFKFFNWAFALFDLVTVITLLRTKNPLVIGVSLLSLVIMLVFTFGKNLGRKKSYTLAGTNLGIFLLQIVAHIVADKPVVGPSSSLLLALVFFIMVYGKYQDKIARGRAV